ncbi:phosphatase PAP2 family protein [Comamonas sp. J-3]|uniref:phosphatase PAP2 family protein n=1 Tax=Comamonas trifloxystrobinivorans TaxID=3350256 RepID=UPI003729F2AC
MAVMFQRSSLWFAPLWAVLLLLSGPAAAMVSPETARQVAAGLKRLDPWMPLLLVLWLVLGALGWWLVTQPLRARQRLRQQMGADAPVAKIAALQPFVLALLSLLAVLWLGRAVLQPESWGHASLLAWDAWAQQWSQQHVSAAARSRLQYLTDTGDVLWLGVLSVLVAVLLAARRQWLPLLVWGLAIGLNGLGTRVLKNAFQRERPVALYDMLTSGASFPSGHTAGSIVVYGLLWWLLRPALGVRKSWLLGAGFSLLVVLIAASRIWLEAHFFTDVLAGALWGLAILGLAVWALERGRALN